MISKFSQICQNTGGNASPCTLLQTPMYMLTFSNFKTNIYNYLNLKSLTISKHFSYTC